MTDVRDAPADSPASNWSRTSGPSAGLVMFWLATAPTPARRCQQRAATAEEDEIAIPNCPVRAQRATMEKVMRRHPGSRRSRRFPPARMAGPSAHHHPGRDRMHAFDIFPHRPVHGFPVVGTSVR